MPSRIIREGILDSKAVNALSEPAEILYRRLMSVVDDYGRFEADPELIRARCFPRQLDRWPTERVSSYLLEISSTPLVTVYCLDFEKNYLQINNFGQRIQTRASKYPDPLRSSTVIHREEPLHATCARTKSESYSESETNAVVCMSPAREPEPDSTKLDQALAEYWANDNPKRERELEAKIELERKLYTPKAPKRSTMSPSPAFDPMARFDEWLEKYPLCSHRQLAAQMWLSVIQTPVDLELAFAVRDRYLLSANAARGVYFEAHNFLADQAKCHWAGKWPESKRKETRSAADIGLDEWAKESTNGTN